MTPAVKLKTLRICVTDLRRSRDFYSRLFGLTPKEDQDNFVLFNLSGTNLEFVLADDKNPASTGGGIGYFEVTDLQKMIDSATALGAKIWRGPLKISADGWSIVQIRDTAGNVIGFEGSLN